MTWTSPSGPSRRSPSSAAGASSGPTPWCAPPSGCWRRSPRSASSGAARGASSWAGAHPDDGRRDARDGHRDGHVHDEPGRPEPDVDGAPASARRRGRRVVSFAGVAASASSPSFPSAPRRRGRPDGAAGHRVAGRLDAGVPDGRRGAPGDDDRGHRPQQRRVAGSATRTRVRWSPCSPSRPDDEPGEWRAMTLEPCSSWLPRLFAIGLYGALSQQSFVMLMMGLELMINGALLALGALWASRPAEPQGPDAGRRVHDRDGREMAPSASPW